jgi:glucose-6-phosphate 1-dehydrogenase
MIEAGWAIIQPILDAWAVGRGGELDFYPAGSEGPAAANEMIQRDHRAWRAL